MASDKRDFTDFANFPGSIDGSGYHSLPTLWLLDDRNRWRKWDIHIRLIKPVETNFVSIDWNLLEEKQIKIKPEYYEEECQIADAFAQVWVETGILDGKITQNAPTYFMEPKNAGKANERNVFQCALIYARSQWLKRKEKGSTETKKERRSETQVSYFPMLAMKQDKGMKHIKFPAYIQPKLDGMRCLMYLLKKNGGVKNVIAYSRNKKPILSVESIKKILYPYLNSLYDEENEQSIYLDGELYKHGKRLQDITGDARNSSNSNQNEYHIYDCFYPKEPELTFKQRNEQILELFKNMEDIKSVVYVPTELVKSEKQAIQVAKKFKRMGYEGAILRNILGPYIFSADVKSESKLRSNDLVKMKPTFTDEFEVVDYTDGSKGKDQGAIIWICQTTDGNQFNVTPKEMTYEERRELYSKAQENFDSSFKSRMLTVEYQDLSADGIPLRAKSVGFRDYE